MDQVILAVEDDIERGNVVSHEELGKEYFKIFKRHYKITYRAVLSFCVKIEAKWSIPPYV